MAKKKSTKKSVKSSKKTVRKTSKKKVAPVMKAVAQEIKIESKPVSRNCNCFNVGRKDKIIRVVIGLVIAAIGFAMNSWIFYVVALIPILTATIGICPLYFLFKINTTKKN